MHLSRTAAIKTASRYVTIGAHGRQYVVYHPHSFDNLDGPNTHGNPRDYWQALAARTRMRADLALHLMGISDDEPYSVAAEVERAHHDGITTVESLVVHVARRLAAQEA